MKDLNSTPTYELLNMLLMAYQHFNDELFNDELADCMFTLQREKQTMGYFSRDRWVSTADGRKIHELAVNPAYFARYPLKEVLQTLVHEMAHFWQYEFGTPGRARYHNKEWGDKMESLGLMPSSTGRPGGKRTGDHMADYAISGGLFERSCVTLIDKGFMLPWVDRAAVKPNGPPIDQHSSDIEVMLESGSFDDDDNADEQGEQDNVIPFVVPAPAAEALSRPIAEVSPDFLPEQNTELAAKKQKVKYHCPCGNNVWGKPHLNLICADCEGHFIEQ